jgi:hypothetical protein
MLLVTTLATGVAIMLLAAATSLVVGAVLALALGAALASSELADTTLTQRAVRNDVLGRVFGALETVYFATVAVGAAIAAALDDAVGTRVALAGAGALLAAVTLALWRPLAALRVEPLALERVELLHAIPIFAPLPGPVVERLALQLQPVHATAGSVIFASGDPGDRYFAVEAGEVEVHVDGRPTRRLGRGDGFGEIALLRETPRTATVVAVTDVDMIALERDEFVAAVTGHAASADAADALIASRLAAVRL